MTSQRIADESKLGKFVLQYREREGLRTQSHLDDELNKLDIEGVEPSPQKYTNKIEKGRVTNLNSGFVQRFAKLTGKSPEDILALHKSNKTHCIKVGVGHSFWAAPLFLSGLQGKLKNIAWASFAHNGNKPRATNACWFTPEDISTGSVNDLISSSPNIDRKCEPTSRPLSASDILRWLNEGDIDIAVVAGAAIENRSEFRSIGRLVDSAAGCAFVANPDITTLLDDKGYTPYASLKKNCLGSNYVVPTDVLGEILFSKARSNGEGNLPRIGIQGDTVSEQFLRAICASASIDAELDWLDVAADFDIASALHKSYSDIEDDTNITQKRRPLAGIITWEPLASWILLNSDKSQDEQIPESFALQLSYGVAGPACHLTFDVVVRVNDVDRPDITDAAYRLIEASHSITGSLLHLSPKSEGFEMLVSYFGIKRVDLASTYETYQRILRTVRYCAYMQMGYSSRSSMPPNV